MGSTPKDFILFDGPATEGVAKMNLLNYIKYSLKQIEKDKVNYVQDNFTIGRHTFRYDSLQALELADLRVEHRNGILITKYIRIVGKDGKEFILIPSMVGGDTVRSLSARSEDLMNFLKESWVKLNPVEKVQIQKHLRPEKIDKIWKMLSVTTRIKMDMLQKALGLDTTTFNDKIFDWAAAFHFKIDGDFVVIEGGDVEGFISKLEDEFRE